MVDYYDNRYFKYQRLTDNKIMVTFKPYRSRLSKETYFCIFEPGTKYYLVADKCMNGSQYWLEINWLAYFVRNHDKQVISLI